MNEQMKEVFNRRNFVVLDTKATGLRRPCEIIDIAILDAIGQVQFSGLICPKEPIPALITDLTGITNQMCGGLLTWPEMKPYIMDLIANHDVITYNAKSDRHMLHCSDDMWELPQTDYKLNSPWYCAMEAYAPHHGEFDDYYGSWRWAKLTEAMVEQGLPLQPVHRALNDALMTFQLLEKMCS
jgi:DNA polymerase-3 subunit epsilon